jgi:uncharacterized protein
VADTGGGSLLSPGPVPAGERLPLLDVLRGLALVGVLLANLPVHHSGPLLGAVPGYDGADAVLVRALGALFLGKFFVLFSLLFGLGLVLQDQRARARGEDVRPRYRRRLVGLVALGVAHGVLLFDGDILMAYGLLGFLLPAFLGSPVRRLVQGAVALVVAGALLSAGGAWAAGLGGPAAAAGGRSGFITEALLRAGTMALQVPLLLVAGLPVLGMFLLGLAVARAGWLEQEAVLRRWRGPVLLVGLALAVPGGWLAGAVSLPLPGSSPSVRALGTLAVGLGGPLVALGMIGWTARWLAAGAGRPAAVLGAVGRMSLTCYLGQSVLLQPLLSPWGIGLAQRWPLWTTVPLSLAVYAALAAFAWVWLARFRLGPAEWLLRSWTYRQRQPLRRG